MRVIAGDLRGRRLKAPAGDVTRPTADRVRESLFNLLGPLPRGIRVLDLYAGSGALGIEALSRGAREARFVESRRPVRRVLEGNLADLRLAERARVASGDAGSAATWGPGPWDLVFADPPYGTVDLPDLAARLAGVLAEDGVIALEHEGGDDLPEVCETLTRWKSRRYGGTRVTLYARKEDAD